jgi:hypothetical protein
MKATYLNYNVFPYAQLSEVDQNYNKYPISDEDYEYGYYYDGNASGEEFYQQDYNCNGWSYELSIQNQDYNSNYPVLLMVSSPRQYNPVQTTNISQNYPVPIISIPALTNNDDVQSFEYKGCVFYQYTRLNYLIEAKENLENDEDKKKAYDDDHSDFDESESGWDCFHNVPMQDW